MGWWWAQVSAAPVAGYKPPAAAADINPETLKEAERLLSEHAEFARMAEVSARVPL